MRRAAHHPGRAFIACSAAVLMLVSVVEVDARGFASERASGSMLWTRRYQGPGNGNDYGRPVVVSPDGTRVFVTGTSKGSTGGFDYATLAYDASTGAVLWTSRYNGPGNGFDSALAAAASPDGTRVYVTGHSAGSTTGLDYATLAYDAATGATIWTSRYNGPGNGDDFARSVVVSPDGTRVYATGRSAGTTTGVDYATLAYDAATGARIWTKRYKGPANGADFAHSVAVGPDGMRVYVTGHRTGSNSAHDYTTLAYDAPTGHRIWTSRYNGPGNGDDDAYSVAVSPDGTRVCVTGHSEGSKSADDYATIAYGATGHRIWVSRYNGPGNDDDYAYSVAVSPDGTRVFVTGHSIGRTSRFDYATLAYAASTGRTLWTSRYNGPGNSGDFAYSEAVSPDGTKVFVTGHSNGSTTGLDYATVAYDASSGARLWRRRYDGPRGGDDYAHSVGVSPDGTKVYVTGHSAGSSGFDYLTIAYAA